MEHDLKDFLSHIETSSVSDLIISGTISNGEVCLCVDPLHILEVANFLRTDKHYEFRILVDICGVDYPDREIRFEVVYHFLSILCNLRLRVKVIVADGGSVPSLSSIFPCANWYEREAFDLYGILFSDHPDLRRLLTDYNFEGYPLRKDFPLTGFVELRYDASAGGVVYEPVRLSQDYRYFDYLSPWSGMGETGEDKAGDGLPDDKVIEEK